MSLDQMDDRCRRLNARTSRNWALLTWPIVALICALWMIHAARAQAQVVTPSQINTSAASVTLIAAVPNQSIHLLHLDHQVGGATNITFEYTSGAGCTGTIIIIAYYSWTAANGISIGSGEADVLPQSPPGYNLCMLNSGAVQVGGAYYAQQR